MATPPSGAGVGSSIPPPPPNIIDTPAITPFQQDTIDSGSISILDYMQKVSSASNAFTENLYEKNQAIYELRIELYRAFAEQSTQLQNLFNGILTQLARWRDVFTQQTNQHAAINAYSFGTIVTIQIATNNFNQAVNDYNAGRITQAQYQTAVNTYNSTVDPLVTAFNNTATAYNQFNATVNPNQGFGMPNLANTPSPLLQVPTNITAASSPPASRVPATAPSLTNIPISPPAPSDAAGLDQFFGSQATAIIVASGVQFFLLKSLDNLTEDIREVKRLTGHLEDSVVVDTSGAEPIGTGSAVLNMMLGSDSRLIDRVTTALYSVTSVAQGKPLPPDVVDQLQLFSLLLFSHAAVEASEAVSQQLSDQSVVPKGVPIFFNVSSALALANSVQTAIGSPGISEGVRAIINTDSDLAGLSLSDKQDLIAALTASVNLSLLQSVVAQLASALQTPGLSSQIFGSAVGLPALLGSNAGGDVNRVLDDASGRTALLQTLQKTFTDTSAPGASLGTGLSSVGRAVAAVTGQRGFASLAGFHASLVTALRSQGIPRNQIQALANAATAFVRNEAALPFLSNAFVPGPLPALLSSLHASQLPPVPPTVLPPEVAAQTVAGTPQSDALLQVFQQAATNKPFLDALDKTFTSSLGTVRDFRDQLVGNLITSGVTADEANGLANVAAVIFTPPAQTGGPLQTTQPTALLSRSELLEALTGTVGQQLTAAVGPGVQHFAELTNRTVINILDRLNEQIRLLKSLSRDDAQKKDILNQFIANARDLSQSSTSLNTFINRVNQFIKTQVEAVQTPTSTVDQSELRTTKRAPGSTAYKADIDIRI